MRTITATLEPHADGTLHLPLPPVLRHGRVTVTATIGPADDPVAADARGLKGFGSLKGKIAMAPDFDAPLDDFRDYME